MAVPVAAALTGLAGVGSALGSISSSFAKQSHSVNAPAARVDTSTAALAGARDAKHLRAMERNADKERTLALMTDPQVMGLLVTFGGLMLASRVPFHENRRTNQNLQAIAAASAVLMGLGRAGVGDLTTLALATGTGTALVLGNAFDSAGGSDWQDVYSWPGSVASAGSEAHAGLSDIARTFWNWIT